MRPHQYYKQIFHQQVAALNVGSLLDVGCGSGSWVGELRKAGLEAYGLDTLASTTNQTPWLRSGKADALPFADKSVDLVTSEFSAHHFEDLERHLAEAARVARIGIAILDPWYDETIASQRVARSLDLWFKGIDQAAGEIHHPVISSDQFLRTMPSNCDFEASFQSLLKIESVPQDKQQGWFEQYAEKCGQNPERMAELTTIKRSIETDGLSQDGAIIFIALFDTAHG